jgi:hypothetical protein
VNVEAFGHGELSQWRRPVGLGIFDLQIFEFLRIDESVCGLNLRPDSGNV